MVQGSPSEGVSETPAPVQDWAADTIETLKTSSPEKRTDILRILLTDKTLDDLQALAEKVETTETFKFSEGEEVELAEHVRSLIPEGDLEKLLEKQGFEERLQILEGRRALLTLVSRHLEPGLDDRVKGWVKKGYEFFAGPSSAGFRKLKRFARSLGLGRIFRKMIGGMMASPAAFVNKVQLIFYKTLGSPAGAALTSLPWGIGHSIRRWAIENRTYIEIEERIRVVMKNMRKRLAIPFMEFKGLDQAAFSALKLKHLPKDAVSEELTPAINLAIIKDVTTTTRKYIDFRVKQDPGSGRTEKKMLVIAMNDLVNFNPEAATQAQQVEEEKMKRQKIIETWKNPEVQVVEYGTGYTFSRADKKITLPKEASDENGVPTTDEAKKLKEMVTQLPSSVQKISIVNKNQDFVLGTEVQFPLGRKESVANVNTLLQYIESNSSKISILRSTKEQTMSGDIRYRGNEQGLGVLEWKSTKILDPASELASFFNADPALFSEEVVPGTRWRKMGGSWKKISSS